MAIQLIISFLVLLLFVAALVAPFVYTLYKQKQDREENARRESDIHRSGEGEADKLDPSPKENYHRYSGSRGHRVESRPPRVDGAGREVYSTPYSAPEKKSGADRENRAESREEDSLIAHTEEFSSEALSSSLDKRYNGWDEMSRDADNWNKPAKPFAKKPPSPGAQSSTPGSLSAASAALKTGKQAGKGSRRIRSLPELKRALVMSQVLGPPKTLELEQHPGYGRHE